MKIEGLGRRRSWITSYEVYKKTMNNFFFLHGDLHRDLLLAVTDASVQDALVGDKADAEVELEEGADEELDDDSSPVKTNVVVVRVVAVVHSCDDNLNDVENGPGDGTDDEHSDETVDPHGLLLVDTDETVGGHNSHHDVKDSENNTNSGVTTIVRAVKEQYKTAVSVENEHEDSDDHGAGVQREAQTAVLDLWHLSGQTLSITGDHWHLCRGLLLRVDNCRRLSLILGKVSLLLYGDRLGVLLLNGDRGLGVLLLHNRRLRVGLLWCGRLSSVVGLLSLIGGRLVLVGRRAGLLRGDILVGGGSLGANTAGNGGRGVICGLL
ncbi:hypothetical protein EDD21DRAFT_382197 [Dissophora ornata]|nr:hypothetical protein EDD21DRAFT_382197 [Dissophora ornata]